MGIKEVIENVNNKIDESPAYQKAVEKLAEMRAKREMKKMEKDKPKNKQFFPFGQASVKKYYED